LVTYVVALHTAAGLDRDLSLYRSASGYAAYPVRLAGARALETIDVASILVALGCLAAVGVLRRSPARAVAAVVLVAVSVGTAELVKHGLPHVAHGLPPGREATWPSGHLSIAASLAFALVLAAPAVVRPAAAVVGAAYAAGIGLSVVVVGWHYPSDVVGSFFICGFWAAVVAMLLPAAAVRARLSPPGVLLALGVVACGLVLAAALAEAHPGAVAAARSSRSVVGVAVVVGLLGTALFAAFTPLVSERER
jgi:membrane-associated phospholipid phosphatase